MLCGLEEVLQTPNTRDDDNEDTWSAVGGSEREEYAKRGGNGSRK
jgi:hypothetical protein